MGGVIPAGAGSGNTLYGQILSALDATIWNGSALVTYSQGGWSLYAVSMPEQAGSSRYIMTVPATLPAGRYFVMPFVQAGGSPAAGDTPIDILFFDWDGTNVLGYGSALNVGSIAGSATAATKLAVGANAQVSGAAAAGTLTSSQMTTNLTATVANQYAGRVLIFTSGVNAGRAVLLTAYAVTGGLLTFIGYNNLTLATPPSAADTFIIL